MSQSTSPAEKLLVGSNNELQQQVLASIAGIQSHDPLATVTLIVPNRSLGWMLRRQLARGLEPGKALINIGALTSREFLDECARAYGLPASTTSETVVRAAVIESTLQSSADTLGVSTGHPETAMLLARLLTELEWCPLTEESLSSIAGVSSPTSQAAIEFASRARSDIFTRLGELDLVTLSQNIVQKSKQSHTPPAGIRALGSLVVVVQSIPTPVLDVMTQVGFPIQFIRLDDSPVQIDSGNARVHSAPDPESESAIAVRFAGEALAQGVKADQIALLYSVDQPYASLLKRALHEAKITWHGQESGSLRESVLSRRADSLLELATELGQGLGIRRPTLMKWLALNPAGVSPGEPQASKYRDLIRSEGLYGDAQQWTQALKEISAQAEELAKSDLDELDSKSRRRVKLGPTSRLLMADLELLKTHLETINTSKSWQEIVVAFQSAIEQYDPSVKKSLSPAEATVRTMLTTLCNESLPRIDELLNTTNTAHLQPSANTLRALIEKEVDSRKATHGDPAMGIHVGPVGSTRGLTFERVIIVGGADGLLPSIRNSNPLFDDPTRSALRKSPADAPTVADLERGISSQVHGVVRGSTQTIVLFPRGAIPVGGVAKPSRYFTSHGTTPPVENLDFASVESALSTGPRPVTERDLAVRVRMSTDEIDPELIRKQVSVESWARPRFNEFFGHVGDQVLSWDIAAKPLSASAIEIFLHCPHRFFVEKILGIDAESFEDETDGISARDLGLMLHSALEELVNTAKAEGWLPGPGEPWPENASAQLRTLFEAEADRATAVGLTGWLPAWQELYDELLPALDEFLTVDDLLRSDPPMAPGIPEFKFGEQATESVKVFTESNTPVQLHGAIDRLDFNAEETIARVIDYKSGNPKNFKTSLNPSEKSGKAREKIQDLVYSAAVRALYPNVTDTRVSFMFVPGDGEVEVVAPKSEQDPATELEGILNGLERAAKTGKYPLNPKGNKDYCPVCQLLGRRAVHVQADYLSMDISALIGEEDGEDS